MKNQFSKGIEKSVKGALQAASRFYMSSFSAFLFMLLMMVQINTREVRDGLMDSLEWSLLFMTVFGLAAVVFVRTRKNTTKNIHIANGLTAISGVVLFIILFVTLTKKLQDPSYPYSTFDRITQNRLSILLIVTFIAFLVFAAKPSFDRYVSRTLFMTQKAIIISGLYGLVLLIGTFIVVGAIQGLLFADLEFTTYQYLGSIIGFITFMLFLGNLPDFSLGEEDEKRKEVEKQPRFIRGLFTYILVPITLALTGVLLLWIVRVVFEGIGENFTRLSAISATYAAIGIWLHMMVREYENALAKFYIKVYPIATVIILAFEVWAIISQLLKYGVQTDEYYFIIVWIVSVAMMVLLLLNVQKSYTILLLLMMGSLVLIALPVVGYEALPAHLQTKRLEKLLNKEQMFDGEKITASSETLPRKVREQITSSAIFLSHQSEQYKPKWLTVSAYDNPGFTEVMGFAPVYPNQDDTPTPKPEKENKVMDLRSKDEALSIQDYNWRIPFIYNNQLDNYLGIFDGKKGTYQIVWDQEKSDTPPTLKITRDNQLVFEESLAAYTEALLTKYPPILESKNDYQGTAVSDLSFPIETDEIKGILLFNTITVTIHPDNDQTDYWYDVAELYISETE